MNAIKRVRRILEYVVVEIEGQTSLLSGSIGSWSIGLERYGQILLIKAE